MGTLGSGWNSWLEAVRVEGRVAEVASLSESSMLLRMHGRMWCWVHVRNIPREKERAGERERVMKKERRRKELKKYRKKERQKQRKAERKTERKKDRKKGLKERKRKRKRKRKRERDTWRLGFCSALVYTSLPGHPHFLIEHTVKYSSCEHPRKPQRSLFSNPDTLRARFT